MDFSFTSKIPNKYINLTHNTSKQISIRDYLVIYLLHSHCGCRVSRGELTSFLLFFFFFFLAAPVGDPSWNVYPWVQALHTNSCQAVFLFSEWRRRVSAPRSSSFCHRQRLSEFLLHCANEYKITIRAVYIIIDKQISNLGHGFLAQLRSCRM